LGSALAVVVGYMVLVSLASSVFGARYDEPGDTVGNVVRGLLVPIAILSALLAALVSWRGWWHVLRDDRSAPRWLWSMPALLVLTIAIGLLTANWGARSALYAVVAALACLCVGFNEEIVFREIALVGLRARVAEWQVFSVHHAAFGVAHGVNLFFGQGLGPTALQVVLAIAFGSAMYVCRVSGTLVLCMALHALWDFTGFVREGPEGVLTTTAIGGSVSTLLKVAAIVVIVALFVGMGLFSDSQPAARVR
jgi:hypothetical protein